MNNFTRINYIDLGWELLNNRVPPVLGRSEEVQRISRVRTRKLFNNCILVGQSGIGKTSTIYAWAKSLPKESLHNNPIVMLDAESLHQAATTGGFPALTDALSTLPACTIIIDDFGRLVFNKPALLQNLMRLLKPLLDNPKSPIILSTTPKEYQWILSEELQFQKFFEALTLKEMTIDEQKSVIKLKWSNDQVSLPEDVLELIIQLTQRYKKLGQAPGSCIQLLDEALSLARVNNQNEISRNDIETIVAEKIGMPAHQLRADDLQTVKELGGYLTSRVLGQDQAISKITAHLQRAKLGLKNPQRPLASFLVLGPSGVGKTETAKALSQKLFGRKESFIRIDMSEFAESHTVQRLLGAPAGYVGYDAGGGLTNPVKEEPYSLVLLDEIEKAHPKIFDIFLQVLDDGRLTSGQSETVDFTNTVIMATSNLAVDEILEGFQTGTDINDENFLQKTILPKLTSHFRTEFLNRFDAVIIFKPLAEEDLLNIALLEIKKIEERMSKHKIKFSIEAPILIEKIKKLADPRFGARPVKRYIEEICENLIAQTLLK